MSLFLDSGAFSAFSLGIDIDIYDYIEHIKQNKKLFEVYACLDVIGSAEKTYENQLIMEKEGLSPLITFHYGEDIEWLKFYMKKYDYIALGGVADGRDIRSVRTHLDKCWEILTDDKGMPKLKVHGFGVTSISLMRRYPWYSVDSTSWAVVSRMGSIIVPIKKNNEWVYNKNSSIIGVTARSPYRNDKVKHYNNLSPMFKKIVDEYLEQKGYKIGKSEFIDVDKDYKPKRGKEFWYKKEKKIERVIEPGVSNNHVLRNEITILYFQDLAKTMPEWPWPYKRKQKKGFLK